MHIITRSATRENPSLLLNFMMCGGFYRHHRDGTFRIRTINGDGNCLFRSLSFFVYNDEDQHHRIRQRLVEHVSDNWGYFRNFSTSKNVLSYRSQMESPGVYGTESEIFAFTEEYHRRVVIYFKDRPDQEPVEIGDEIDTIYLLYSGPTDHGHYDVLIRDSIPTMILAQQKKKKGSSCSSSDSDEKDIGQGERQMKVTKKKGQVRSPGGDTMDCESSQRTRQNQYDSRSKNTEGSHRDAISKNQFAHVKEDSVEIETPQKVDKIRSRSQFGVANDAMEVGSPRKSCVNRDLDGLREYLMQVEGERKRYKIKLQTSKNQLRNRSKTRVKDKTDIDSSKKTVSSQCRPGGGKMDTESTQKTIKFQPKSQTKCSSKKKMDAESSSQETNKFQPKSQSRYMNTREVENTQKIVRIPTDPKCSEGDGYMSQPHVEKKSKSRPKNKVSSRDAFSFYS